MISWQDLLALRIEAQTALKQALTGEADFALTVLSDDAGNASMQEAVNHGRFREDLYYRLWGEAINLAKIGWNDGETEDASDKAAPRLEAARRLILESAGAAMVVGGSRRQRLDLRGVLTSPYRSGDVSRPSRVFPDDGGPSDHPEDSWLFLSVEDLVSVPLADQQALFARLPRTVRRVVMGPSTAAIQKARKAGCVSRAARRDEHRCRPQHPGSLSDRHVRQAKPGRGG